MGQPFRFTKNGDFPGPKGRSLLNDLKALQENPLQLLNSSFTRYGDLVWYSLGPHQVYIISHPAAVQHILQLNHRNYTTLEIVGKALFSEDLSDQAKELTRATLAVLDYIAHRARHPFSLTAGQRITHGYQASLRKVARSNLCS